jgi:hypothetical protein
MPGLTFEPQRRSLTVEMSTNLMATPIDTIPGSVTQATTESFTYTFDFAPNMAVGETIISAATTCTDISVTPTVPVSLPDNPSINTPATSVNQAVRGTSLTAAHVYRVVVTATLVTGPPAKAWSMATIFNCPF